MSLRLRCFAHGSNMPTHRTVEVRSPAGTLPAMTYIAEPAHRVEGLSPFPWYQAFVVVGALQNRRILAEAGLPGTP